MASVYGKYGGGGFDEAKSILRSMKRAATSGNLKTVVQKVQDQALKRFDQVVYGRGTMYGQTLAEIFSKTRPRRSDGRGSVGGRGRGTPVKTGRLQRSLTEYQNEFAIYERKIRNDGSVTIKYGGKPADPKTRRLYISAVEDKYGFLADGIKKFEQGQAMKMLAADLAQMFSKAFKAHFAQASRSRK